MDGIFISFHSVVRLGEGLFTLFLFFFYLFLFIRAVVACRMDIDLPSFMYCAVVAYECV